MKTLFSLLFILFSLVACQAQKHDQSVKKNGMTAHWKINNDRIFVTLEAPTDGWVAIGFNKKTGIQGTHLIMGSVQQEKTKIVEYYTVSPGDYRPLSSFNVESQLDHKSGLEVGTKTTISFSLPIEKISDYRNDLKSGTTIYLTMAFSREDDFEHHSMMRTEVTIKL